MNDPQVTVMTWVLIVLGIGAVFVIAFLLGGWAALRHREAEVARIAQFFDTQQANERRKLLGHMRSTYGWRAEIVLQDWGAEEGEMRWRWTVWDADRALAVLVDPTTEGPGFNLPVMLGNAPTKYKALNDAVLWVTEYGADAIVVAETS